MQLLQDVFFQNTIYIISRTVRGVKYVVRFSVFDIVIQSHVLLHGNNTITVFKFILKIKFSIFSSHIIRHMLCITQQI